MPILFSCIAKGTNILVREGNNKDFQTIVDALLEKVPEGQETKKAYVQGSYSFNYIATKEGYVFVCVADKSHKTNICFLFLKEIQKNFDTSAPAKFKNQLKKYMLTYSNDKEVDKIAAINAELEDVKNIMQENIDKVVKRGEKLEELEETTQQLEVEASGFRTRATQLKNTVWWGSLRMKIIIGVAILVVIGIIILAICVSPANICKAPEPSPSTK
eukprot:TRINITY_DN1814_c1_g9_i1.p1 TRINITY_DN1814_c1_g9~~TRINITY_DN1814_c1_g9_i1.p1  ORF type:complete len:216 (-),score=35.49 TRINITY_DN1814_c1_g9_i1:164-811(-)